MQLLLLGAAVLSAMASALFGLLYYTFYWQYHGLFNEEGRYFDEINSVVYHSQAGVIILPTLGFLLLAALFASIWWARRHIAFAGSMDKS